MGGRETLTNMATLECRVQYLDDRDPFASTNFPEPTRPPSYSFLLSVALENQITGVHRLLQAPHKVGLRSNQYSGGHGLRKHLQQVGCASFVFVWVFNGRGEGRWGSGV